MKRKSNGYNGINHLQFLFAKKLMEFQSERVMYTVLERAYNGSKVLAPTGREGTAKTTAIAEFVLTHANCFYVNIGQSFGPSNFFDEMIETVSHGKEKPVQDMYTKMKQLTHLLTADDARKLIVVDDAGKLSPRGLGLYHELRIWTMHCTGFVFCGVSYFKDRLEKAMRKGVPGVAEFYRRVQGWPNVPNINGEDIANYCAARGLTDEEKKLVSKKKLETVAELEIFVDDLIELRKK